MQMKHLNTSAKLSTVWGLCSLSPCLAISLELLVGPAISEVLFNQPYPYTDTVPGTGGEQDLFLSLSAMVMMDTRGT